MWTVTRFDLQRRGGQRESSTRGSELLDLGDLRRDIIAGLLKGTPIELEALNALGKGALPLEREPMLDLARRVTDYAREELNALAGIVEGAPITETEQRLRCGIAWALYDMVVRAKVAPNRIKIERQLGEIVGLKTTTEVIKKLHVIIPRVRRRRGCGLGCVWRARQATTAPWRARQHRAFT